MARPDPSRWGRFPADNSPKTDTMPIGTLWLNADGVMEQWHGWGWAPANPNDHERSLIATRDRAWAAKSRYGPIAKALGASRMTHSGSNPDGATYGRYVLGDNLAAIQFIERDGEEAAVWIEMRAIVPVESLDGTDLHRLAVAIANTLTDKVNEVSLSMHREVDRYLIEQGIEPK